VRTLYNIFFIIFFVLTSPYYFWRMWRRGNWQNGFAQRFGKYDANLKQSITNRHTIWMHAVSVGEANICTQLIRALEPRVPNLKIIVSTTTTTGMGELQRKLPAHVGKIYYPVDRRKYVSRALAAIRPEAIILVEAEIWPNFLWRAHDKKIPVFLVNARLSEKSYPRYKRFAFLFRPLFAAFAGVGAQNKDDAERMKQVGCKPETICIAGNLKFDSVQLNGRQTLDVPAMFRQLGVPPNAKILVAGSTHNGEEKILAEQFLRLRKKFPDLFLVLVPRHFERTKEVARELQTTGVSFVLRNELKPDKKFTAGEVSCLLVNTTGELNFFYEQATLVFVGKSLTSHGGQNPIEPGALGKAMVFGPNMENFRDVVREFLSAKGAVQVQEADGLEKVFGELLADEKRRAELGRNALEVVKKNQGGVNRTVEMILKHLDNGEIYVARAEQL